MRLQQFSTPLNVLAPGQVVGNGGAEAHALMFQLWNAADQGWAKRVHALVDKPFSLRLEWPGAAGARPGALQEGTRLTLCVGTLTAEAGAMTEQALAAARGAEVRLGTATASLGEYRRRWQEPLTAEDLAPAEPGRRLELHFLSPTSFRRHGEQLLLPVPDLVFTSLARRFNVFAEQLIPAEWAADLGRLWVDAYHLQTDMVEFRDYRIKGFVGRIAYLAPPDLPVGPLRTLWALGHFAEVAGCGYKSTMGMGWVRCQ